VVAQRDARPPPEVDEDANTVFDHNTVQNATLANGMRSTAAGTTPSRTTSSPIRSREGSGLHAGSPLRQHAVRRLLKFTDNTTVRPDARLNWNSVRRDLALRAPKGRFNADVPGHGGQLPPEHLQRDHGGRGVGREGSVRDPERPLHGHPRRRHGHVGRERSCCGAATFDNVDARNVGAVGINNCGTFHFTSTGSDSRSSGVATTAEEPPVRVCIVELPNAFTSTTIPPIVVPPPPSAW